MIYASVTGDREVVTRLQAIAPNLRELLRKEVAKQAIDLQAYVKSNYLSGQALKNRSGHLRASINVKNYETADEITATVGTNVSYAAVHEFGFHGVESVRAHLRMMTMAFGKEVKDPHQISVKGFERHVNYNGHPYLRPALADRKEAILSGLRDTVARGVV